MTDTGNRLTLIGLLISLIGAIVIMASLVLGSLPASNGGSTSFGGVIVVGPIPIVFGTDRTAVLIAVVGAVILFVLSLAVMFVNSRKIRQLANEKVA